MPEEWHFRFQQPRICLSFPTHQLREIAHFLPRVERWADLFEVRLDRLRDWRLEDLALLREQPVVWTYRPERQGGEYRGPEEERLEILLEIARRGWGRWVDLEYDVEPQWIQKIRVYTRVLLSYHGPDLATLESGTVLRCLQELPHDAIKVAIPVTRTADAIRFLDRVHTLHLRESRTIWAPVGNAGRWLRILAPWFGSFWTYATLPSSGPPTGAGQPPIDHLIQIYRYREMRPDHRLYGVVGQPLRHSLSPYLHNLCLREMNVAAHYIPFEVDDLEPFFRLLQFLPLQGLSVTHPHKETFLTHIQRFDEHTQAIGALNTVARRDDAWYGYNTDWSGFWDSLVQMTGRTHWKALLIGTGGAARAVAYALWRNRQPFMVLGRSLQRAAALAQRFGGRAVRREEVQPNAFDLLIQATPVGMYGYPQRELDLPDEWLVDKVIYDVVYNPPLTPLLMRARAAGAALVISGLEMFVEQAKGQLLTWLEQAPPHDFMMASARAFLEHMDQEKVFPFEPPPFGL